MKYLLLTRSSMGEDYKPEVINSLDQLTDKIESLYFDPSINWKSKILELEPGQMTSNLNDLIIVGLKVRDL